MKTIHWSYLFLPVLKRQPCSLLSEFPHCVCVCVCQGGLWDLSLRTPLNSSNPLTLPVLLVNNRYRLLQWLFQLSVQLCINTAITHLLLWSPAVLLGDIFSCWAECYELSISEWAQNGIRVLPYYAPCLQRPFYDISTVCLCQQFSTRCRWRNSVSDDVNRTDSADTCAGQLPATADWSVLLPDSKPISQLVVAWNHTGSIFPICLQFLQGVFICFIITCCFKI